MAYRLLLRYGWSVNHKRVQHIWREEDSQEAETGAARRWFGEALPGGISPLGVVHGLLV